MRVINLIPHTYVIVVFDFSSFLLAVFLSAIVLDELSDFSLDVFLLSDLRSALVLDALLSAFLLGGFLSAFLPDDFLSDLLSVFLLAGRVLAGDLLADLESPDEGIFSFLTLPILV